MNGSSSNPSDYEFLLRTLTQGNHVARAESLKRFNTLILSDKKQFASYAKRIVIGIQQLMMEQKEDINLLACTLALEIINLNPRDIEFYIKSKLLKPMVLNLGDAKPQIRKTSHYCLLGYVRTFKNFDDLIEAYITYGIMSKEWQLKQKSINSFQSILVMEMRYVDWSSALFKRIFELLLTKLKDENGFVQKASEQCLLSLAKVSELRNFSKKLNPVTFNMLRGFCQQQYELGNLNEIKLDQGEKPVESERYNEPQSPSNKERNGQSSTFERADLQKGDSKVAPLKISEVPEETFRKKKNERNSLKKAESSMTVNQHKELIYSLNLRQVRNPEREENLKRQTSLLLPPIANANNAQIGRHEKIEQIVGKKLMQDLKNDRDWKTRLQAVEQLQTKYQISRDQFDQDMLMRYFVPTLIRLLGDSNFKVALVALKILQEILHSPNINLEQIVPQIVDKLADNKVALRQNISKLIKREYSASKQGIWLDSLLLHIKKSANANIKEQVLNILYKVYDEGSIPYNFERILQVISPLMEDLKTKIKIKTLDLMAIITIKSQKIDRAKNILASKMNQIYYEMYLEKIGKELKANRDINHSPEKQNHSERDKPMRTSMHHISRKINKIGNTTSTSLQRYANNKTDQNSTVKTAFYQPNLDEKRNTIVSRESVENFQTNAKEATRAEVVSVTDDEGSSVKKTTTGTGRYLRRRAQKSVESRLSTTNYSNDDGLAPFSDPNKQLKSTLLELKSDDWQVANEALTKLRRIIRHHADLIVGSTIKAVVPEVMKLSESLRSTLSKSAVVVINELSTKLKRQLDSEFDLIFSKLIKKSLDTNSFISEQVKKALITVCSNCNEGKVMNSLNASHTSRAIPVKVAIVNILEGITFEPRFYERELEKIVIILCDFMNEGSLQIRQKTKQLLNSIISSENGPSIMRLIPNQHRNKLKKAVELSPTTTKCDLHLEPSIQEDKKQSAKEDIYQRKKKKVKITNFPQQFQEIDGYLENCESSDWKTRLQSMNSIAQLCRTYSEQILQHRSSSKIIDVMSKQINDPNVKVATNALKIYLELAPIIRVLIEGSLSVIMNEIFICFSSTKAEIRTLAEQLFDTIASNVEKWLLTQHMCNGALYSIQKSKPVILSKLSQLIPEIHKMKPNIFQKNVYAMINKVAEENKPELTAPLKELLEAIYAQTGEDCMSFLKQKAKQLIFQ